MSDIAEDNEDEIPRLKRLVDLNVIPDIAISERVRVEEDGWTYIFIGHALPGIINRLGWDQDSVWMPEHVLNHVKIKHAALSDPIQTGSIIIQEPASVHLSARKPNERYFVMSADRLRDLSLLTSRSVPLVDAVVELRQVSGGKILRLFHLAPATRNRGGRQLWP